MSTDRPGSFAWLLERVATGLYALVATGVPTVVGAAIAGAPGVAGGLIVGAILVALIPSPGELAARRRLELVEHELRRSESSFERAERIRRDDERRRQTQRYFPSRRD